MPSAISNALSKSLLNHAFGNTAYTPASTHYMSLLTTNASDWTTGTGAVEASGVGRVAVTNNATNFPDASTGGNSTVKSNGTAIAFGNAPSNLTFTGFAIYSASSGGTWLAGGTLNTSVAVTTGNAISVGIGSLIIQLNTGTTKGASGYLLRKLLDLAFGAVSYAAPANIFGAYFTTAPNYSAGTGGVEPSAGAYTRVSKTNNTTNFPNATGSATATKSNGTDVAFPNPTASQGTAVAAGYWDAATSGNLLWAIALTTNRALSTSTTDVRFAAGSLNLEISAAA